MVLKVHLATTREGFCWLLADASMFIHKYVDTLTYLLIYIDDIMLTEK
jgi:hypothetical protein